MGSPRDEISTQRAYEGPQHEVTVKPFAIGVYEVTNAAMARMRRCVGVRSQARRRRPGSCWRFWREASDWRSLAVAPDRARYRIPTQEAGMEYAARGPTRARIGGATVEASRVATREPKVVGSFGANGFGLYDVLRKCARMGRGLLRE
ncbi:MAG: SUMF1/EgtB/PvdO family nonheme iron enzyme [Parvularculaceae bacterium]